MTAWKSGTFYTGAGHRRGVPVHNSGQVEFINASALEGELDTFYLAVASFPNGVYSCAEWIFTECRPAAAERR